MAKNKPLKIRCTCGGMYDPKRYGARCPQCFNVYVVSVIKNSKTPKPQKRK